MEATRKALEDLQAKHRARVQHIAEWASEASTTLVPLGMSPIPVSERPPSTPAALRVRPAAAERLGRVVQILGARLGAGGSRLCRAVVEYARTCFWSHAPAISLAQVIDGPVAATKDTARESVQDV